MSSVGAAPRAAAPVRNARAAASRKNGARSRGPKTPEGKARSARNALKHGLRAEKYIVLPEEDAAAFKALEATLFEELAPVGALQSVPPGGSRSPPGGWSGRTGSRSRCSSTGATATVAPASR
jgi:hypothetical protein